MKLIVGNCIDVLRRGSADRVDAIVTDPPYGLGFMGKQWDDLPPGDEFAAEALRVLKPGAHLLAFGGTRTYHRLAVALEDAGFEIRDCLAWMYGTGFPKSLDVSKAIDKAAGAERQVMGTEAERWRGWGTALKPAFEPVVLARKPLSERTVAANIQRHSTGALNIDGTRIGTTKDVPASVSRTRGISLSGSVDGSLRRQTGEEGGFDPNVGRWPANVVLDEEAAAVLDEQTGELPSGAAGRRSRTGMFDPGEHGFWGGYGDSGGASRFFYIAKASRKERNAGLDGFQGGHAGPQRENQNLPLVGTPQKNDHPTVKPIALMRWLVRLVTPPGGLVVDPFVGSGTTGIAALLEGFNFVGIDTEPHYIDIARARMAHAQGDE